MQGDKNECTLDL